MGWFGEMSGDGTHVARGETSFFLLEADAVRLEVLKAV